LSVRFLIDEDVNSKIVKALQHENFELILVSENFSSISDKKILDIAKKLNLILITEEGDFGKLI
jgi:predicted nuclease of predicted toxin-antitoxin system